MQTNLLKPKIISVEALGANQAKVVMEPFERGYGHTLGNALRRVLLSSMVGFAPTEVAIAGVVHEYSTLDGVQEDVVNLLLNLKGVVFKLQSRDEVTINLRKEGPGVAVLRILIFRMMLKSSTLSMLLLTWLQAVSSICRSRLKRVVDTYQAICVSIKMKRLS